MIDCSVPASLAISTDDGSTPRFDKRDHEERYTSNVIPDWRYSTYTQYILSAYDILKVE